MAFTLMKPHLLWKTEAFDHAGNVIATLSKSSHGGLVIEGTSNALAFCLPDLRQIAAFFTAPDALARAAYQEFVSNDAPAFPTWEEIKNNESQRHVIALWRRIAQAVLTVPTTTTP